MAEEEKKSGTVAVAPEAPPVSGSEGAPGAVGPEKEKKEISAAPKLEQIIKEIERLTVLELSDLVKALEQRFGVTAAAPVALAAAATAGGAAPAPVEKTEFTVVLSAVGDKKIQVIKEVRAVTGLGLKEAKELVESAPATVKENIAKEEAETIKKQLEAAGATIQLK